MPIDTHTGQVSKCRIKAEASRTFLQGRSGHFRTLSMMSTHNCSREDCPTTNVNGPKITCVKCKKPQFLQCHAQKHSSGLIRIPLPTGASIYVEMQNMQFGCASCAQVGGIQVPITAQFTPVVKTTPKTKSQTVTNGQILNALQSGFDELKSFIKKNSNDNMATVKSSIEKMDTKVTDRKIPLFSTVLKSKTKFSANETPRTSKRKLNEDKDKLVLVNNKTSEQISSVTIPSPKRGTKELQIGRLVSPVKNRQLNKFTKSIRVSGLHPTVTANDMTEYIISNTNITDKARFSCRPLVKKDQDVTQLSYISFKIDISDEDFNTLMDPLWWPNNCTIREFVRIEKPRDGAPIMISPNTRNEETHPKKLQKIHNTSSSNDIMDFIGANEENETSKGKSKEE